jgi:hypothetical protein
MPYPITNTDMVHSPPPYPPPTTFTFSLTLAPLSAPHFFCISQADPNDHGEAEQWFNPSATFARTAATPGAWQAQGVGNATLLMEHQFTGIGWYRKEVVLPRQPLTAPTPANASTLSLSSGPTRMFLWLGGAPGGVMRSAKVWANGKFVGRHVGYLAPLEMELTAAVTPTAASVVLYSA